MKKTKVVNVNKDAWSNIQMDLPHLSDAKRSVVLSQVWKESSFKKKIEPELTDSKMDRLLKKIASGKL